MQNYTKAYMDGYIDGQKRLYNKILETVYDCQFRMNVKDTDKFITVVKAVTIVDALKDGIRWTNEN